MSEQSRSGESRATFLKKVLCSLSELLVLGRRLGRDRKRERKTESIQTCADFGQTQKTDQHVTETASLNSYS